MSGIVDGRRAGNIQGEMQARTTFVKIILNVQVARKRSLYTRAWAAKPNKNPKKKQNGG